MSAEVQHLLDRLADELGRSVVINDPAVVMLYASRHFGDEDPVRVEAVLNRVAGSAAIAHVLGQDVARWTRPGRIPAKPEIGMRARHCVPLRWHGDLLGLLMVIDADDDLSPAERALIDTAAHEVATLLVSERASADAADDALVADLLSLDPAARQRVVATLTAPGPERTGRRPPDRTRGPGRAALQVIALRADTPDREHAEIALRHAVLAARRTGLATVAGTTAAVVRFGAAHAEELVAAANEVAAGRFTCVAGVGPRDSTALPTPVATLLAADSRGTLVRTLAAYLRHAGSAPAAADELHIHRTTLHYRLDRIREITGCDPDDGETRLLLHLGLGVARLLGLLAGEQTGPGSPAPRP